MTEHFLSDKKPCHLFFILILIWLQVAHLI